MASGDFLDIDRMMKQAIDDFIFPGAVLLFSRNGSILFHEAYGVRNVFFKKPVTRKTIFDLASLTKPLATTVGVMALAKEGALEIKTPLVEILEAFRNTDKKAIGVHDLLRHTSGFPDYRPYYKQLVKKPPDHRKGYLRRLLVKESLIYPTGEKKLYSDLGFMVLSWIIEQLAGCKLDEYVRAKVYDPLNLDALFFNSAAAGKTNGEFAATENCSWRKRVIVGEVHDENAAAIGGVEGHAGLFGTAENVHRLLWHLLKVHNRRSFEGLFPSSLVQAFFRRKGETQGPMGFDAPSLKGSNSGCLFSFESVGHLGFTGTSFWVDLKREITVILLTNRIHPARKNEKIKSFRPAIHDAIMGGIL